ncbi:MAG: hypothetical protein D4R83_04045 [Streptomycetaceae bacterium]|nr:MAG: hypothetical protein D4R83_04045 [Streptomycetaceae bacterium]
MCTAEGTTKQSKSQWYEPQLDLPRTLDLIDLELGRMVDAIKALVKVEARFTPNSYRGLIAEVSWCFNQCRKLTKEQRLVIIDFIEDDTWATSLSEMLRLIDRLGEIKNNENK